MRAQQKTAHDVFAAMPLMALQAEMEALAALLPGLMPALLPELLPELGQDLHEPPKAADDAALEAQFDNFPV